MSGGFTPEECAVWRHLRDAGGYSSAPELLPTFPQFVSAQRLAGALKRLFSNHHLARRVVAGGTYAYGVTTSCSAPEGETLEITS